MKNFHIPLPDQVYDDLKSEAERSQVLGDGDGQASDSDMAPGPPEDGAQASHCGIRCGNGGDRI